MAAGEELFAGLVGVLIVNLAVALIVQLLARRIVRFRPRYWSVYMALVVSSGFFYVAGFLLESVGVLGDPGRALVGNLMLAVAGFFVQAGFMVLFVEGREGEAISYRQSLLVLLAWFGIAVAVAVVVGVVVAVAAFY